MLPPSYTEGEHGIYFWRGTHPCPEVCYATYRYLVSRERIHGTIGASTPKWNDSGERKTLVQKTTELLFWRKWCLTFVKRHSTQLARNVSRPVVKSNVLPVMLILRLRFLRKLKWYLKNCKYTARHKFAILMKHFFSASRDLVCIKNSYCNKNWKLTWGTASPKYRYTHCISALIAGFAEGISAPPAVLFEGEWELISHISDYASYKGQLK